MDAHQTFKEQHNRCMKKARAAEARLRTLTKTYGVVPGRVRAVQVARVQAVALYRSELWWDPRDVGRQDDLQLLLNRQVRSIQGALPTTPQGALMRESGLTPAPVILDSKQQQFTVRLANACSSRLKDLHHNPSSGAPICKEIREQHEHGRTTEGTDWPPLGKESVVRTTILDDPTAAKSAAQRWARENQAKVGAGVWMWWTDGSRSEHAQVGAAAVCKHGNQWSSHHSILGSGRMEVFYTKLWEIGRALDAAIKKREKLQEHRLKTVAVISNSQPVIR